MVAEGFKEITLLGQNVTAYGLDFGDQRNLAWLLRYIHDIKGLERIRFLTGHPHHVDDYLIETVAELPKACEFFHIPMQAGDDEVLRRMARIYKVSDYYKMVEKIRNLMPRASITSDFIVGFPGETHKQFLNTCKVVEDLQFDSCITAMYSPRRGTVGAKWEQEPVLKVSDEEKQERIRHLNALVTDVAEKRSKLYLNTIEEILIEKESERNNQMWMGRTRAGKLINFPKQGVFKQGDLVNVKITQANPWALRGEIV